MTETKPTGGFSLCPKKRLGPRSSLQIWTILAMSMFMVFAVGVSAPQVPGQNGEQTGVRNARVKTRRAPAGRDRNTITPDFVPRDRTSRQPLVTRLILHGINLSGMTARVVRGDQTFESVVARVENTTDSEAHLTLAVPPNTPLGPAQLILSKNGHSDVVVDIRVIEPSEFAIEADTVGLWHFDERDHGMTHLLDAGQNSINLTSARTSRVTEGRFGAGRAFMRATADANNTFLSHGTSSFTIEGWVKAPSLARDYGLVGKESNNRQNTEFTLTALASGALRAEIYDTNGLVWQAETSAAAGTLSDDQWHAFALVVDRKAGSLSLFLDGQVQVRVPAPAGFGAVRNLGQSLQLGSFDADASGNGPEEFPGVLDEIRISSTAHKPEKIAADFFGNDEPKITFVRPRAVKKGAGPIEVTLSGYGLIGATVLPDQPGVTATVLSSTLTSIRISLAVYDFVPAGPASLLFRDVLGRGFSVEFTIEERPSQEREFHTGSPVIPPDLNESS
ncbi:MAG TPA: LamG domain-containing protein [Pyrinomonadaceae bacterium]|nr:LamG domain-containing protein [Pyrinomonadaceae bacterium]